MTIQQRFDQFHQDNPEVYLHLVQYAREVRARGYRKFGIGALWERLRWYTQIETTSGEPFRLSNDFRSRYARLIMQREPDLEGFFNLRELRESPEEMYQAATNE